MSERKLASIQIIKNIIPIEGADRIELAYVQGWQVVVKKGEFSIGDLVVYIEIDSRLPKDNPAFAFLEERSYKVKTIKLRKMLSQGIIFPLSILPNKKWDEGDDVTEELKITKIEDDYQPPVLDDLQKLKLQKKKLMNNRIVRYMLRYVWFRKLLSKIFISNKKKNGWPKWVKKTDEERVQNLILQIPIWCRKYKTFVVTEKLDGTSATFTLRRTGRNKYEYIICSRNVVVGGSHFKKEVATYHGENVYVEMSEKYNIEEVLKREIIDNEWITIQGEIIGESIQGNKYRLKGRELYVFNLIVPGGHIDVFDAEYIMGRNNIKWVPILTTEYELHSNVEEILKYFEGEHSTHRESRICSLTPREGVVIRDLENNVSFKVISNSFLLEFDNK